MAVQMLSQPPLAPAPATPRPAPIVVDSDSMVDESSVKTPTRDSFLHLDPVPADAPATPTPARPDGPLELPDIKPEPKDGAETVESTPAPTRDAKDGSEQDSGEGDGRPSKKKKGQRFFCTEYPPCILSFTRSEHLARHIRYVASPLWLIRNIPMRDYRLTQFRKHTGERPFSCHCGRRFSRLDNLRQHAQTVHVNEDIPMDSLAATGTRYQRQIRTERVRPVNRARASTFSTSSNPALPVRGHGRNLSSSSITSISTTSSFAGDDLRRGALGHDVQRARLSLDTFSSTGSVPVQYYTVGSNSPTGYSTPTSATVSIGTSSPRFSSGIHSPNCHTRPLGWVSKTPSRRLSVPSSNPFQTSSKPESYSSSYMSPVPSAAAPNLSRNGNQYAAPGVSVIDSRRDSAAAEAEWRRRTWHPNTNTGLGRQPSGVPPAPGAAPRPVFPSQQQSALRLPGIESFDQAPPPAATLIRRQPSPMELDHPPPTSHPTEQQQIIDDAPRNRVSWTASLQNGINQLEITSVRETTESPWNPAKPNGAATEQHRPPPLSLHVRQPSGTTSLPPPQPPPQQKLPPPPTPQPAESAFSARKSKRLGWYMQPPSAVRTSPDSASSEEARTPVTTTAEYVPVIVHPNGGHGGHGGHHGSHRDSRGSFGGEDTPMEGVEEAAAAVLVAPHKGMAALPVPIRSLPFGAAQQQQHRSNSKQQIQQQQPQDQQRHQEQQQQQGCDSDKNNCDSNKSSNDSNSSSSSSSSNNRTSLDSVTYLRSCKRSRFSLSRFSLIPNSRNSRRRRSSNNSRSRNSITRCKACGPHSRRTKAPPSASSACTKTASSAVQQQPQQQPLGGDMRRLEALVAVATGEGRRV